MVYYDEDGNPVEGALSPEEAAELQEKIAAIEAEKAKLSDKDKNFEALRKSKEGAEHEKSELQQRLEALEKQREEENKRASESFEASKGKLVENLVNGDAELKKKVEEKLARFVPATSMEEHEANVKDAIKVIFAEQGRRLNPLNAFVPHSGGGSSNFNVGAKQASSDNVIGLARELGLHRAFDKKLLPKDAGDKFMESLNN